MKISKEQLDAFLEEIENVCKEHDISIGHEDSQGAFMFRRYGDKDFNGWLKCGYVDESDNNE